VPPDLRERVVWGVFLVLAGLASAVAVGGAQGLWRRGSPVVTADGVQCALQREFFDQRKQATEKERRTAELRKAVFYRAVTDYWNPSFAEARHRLAEEERRLAALMRQKARKLRQAGATEGLPEDPTTAFLGEHWWSLPAAVMGTLLVILAIVEWSGAAGLVTGP
jgi:hypothetical protein